MMSNIYRALLISAVILEALMPVRGGAALAAPADKVYSVCEIVQNNGTSISHAKNIAGKSITIRGDVGRTFHLGLILADNRCAGSSIRIILPVPDPKNIGPKFRIVYAPSKTTVPDKSYFICDCSGRVSFKYDIPMLFVDGAVIHKLSAPEKSSAK